MEGIHAAKEGRGGESEHKILLTASRPNLIPRAGTRGGREAAEGLEGVGGVAASSR